MLGSDSEALREIHAASNPRSRCPQSDDNATNDEHGNILSGRLHHNPNDGSQAAPEHSWSSPQPIRHHACQRRSKNAADEGGSGVQTRYRCAEPKVRVVRRQGVERVEQCSITANRLLMILLILFFVYGIADGNLVGHTHRTAQMSTQ